MQGGACTHSNHGLCLPDKSIWRCCNCMSMIQVLLYVEKHFNCSREGKGRCCNTDVNGRYTPVQYVGNDKVASYLQHAFEKAQRNSNTKPRRAQNTQQHRPHKHGSTATSANSRRLATKHVPCAIPRSTASVDNGFVEIDHVQISQ